MNKSRRHFLVLRTGLILAMLYMLLAIAGVIYCAPIGDACIPGYLGVLPAGMIFAQLHVFEGEPLFGIASIASDTFLVFLLGCLFAGIITAIGRARQIRPAGAPIAAAAPVPTRPRRPPPGTRNTALFDAPPGRDKEI